LSLFTAILVGLGKGFINLFLLPYHIWQWIQLETLKERMSVLVLKGQSLELLYIVLAFVLLLIVAGIIKRGFLRGTVLKLEGFNRTVGHAASWFCSGFQASSNFIMRCLSALLAPIPLLKVGM